MLAQAVAGVIMWGVFMVAEKLSARCYRPFLNAVLQKWGGVLLLPVVRCCAELPKSALVRME